MADDRPFAFDVSDGRRTVRWPAVVVVACVMGLVAGVAMVVTAGSRGAAAPLPHRVTAGGTSNAGTGPGGPPSDPSAPIGTPDRQAAPGREPSGPSGPAAQPSAVPGTITIPAIGVSSPLISLGLAPDGSLQTPSDFGVAGWWSGGPAPGQVGAAVIVGHVDSKAGPAVFFRLRDLRPGDVVWVTRQDGTRVSFIVRRLEQVPKARFPTTEVYGPQPYAALRLITCGGAFDRSTGHYVDNVIVFADAA